jgi:hypothetical protein
MLLTEGPDAGLFSRKVRRSPGGLELSAASIRYSIISWLGLCSSGEEQAFRSQWQKKSFAKFSAVLDADPHRYTLGDLGLLLWLDRWNGNAWTGRATDQMQRRWREEKPLADSVELAWMLIGLTANEVAPALRADVLNALLACYVSNTSLFVFNKATRSSPVFSDYRGVLGSFASQVYPILALANYAVRTGNERGREAAMSCADRVCSLQGRSGEWWWIYDTRNASVLCDYPVYSVHQDAMGPMALMMAYELSPREHYLSAAVRGLEFLFNYREPNTGHGFIDAETGLIWRAITSLPAEDCADLPFGIAAAQFKCVRRAGWPRALRPKASANSRGYGLLYEARPYCPGWVLFAKASSRDVLG